MQKTLLQRLIFFGSLFLLIGLSDSVKSEEEHSSNFSQSTHRQIPKPLPVKQTNQLLVSLEKYLGHSANDSENHLNSSFSLVSAGQP